MSVASLELSVASLELPVATLELPAALSDNIRGPNIKTSGSDDEVTLDQMIGPCRMLQVSLEGLLWMWETSIADGPVICRLCKSGDS